MIAVPFVKMHGAGNDFVVVDRRDRPDLAAATADVAAFVRDVCERRRGVGADGVLFLDAPGETGAGEGLDFRMRYFNRDGGQADLCGNGGRCLAAFAVARGLGRDGRVVFASDAGCHRASVRDGRVELVLGDVDAPQLDRAFATAAGVVRGASLTVGVPHFVIEVADADAVDLATFAPPLRAHAELGPAGANVNVASVRGAGRVRLRTFERGVEGETLACGTGAAATAIALVAGGRVTAPVTLEVASGDELEVSFREEGGRYLEVTLTGPVVAGFEGTYFWHPSGTPTRSS